jgi:hypothetical protein
MATMDGIALQPAPTPEDKVPALASVYALSKFDQERMCLMMGRAYGIPDRGAALLQRLRAAPGAVEPLHRRAGDLRRAAAERQSRPRSSRTATSSATS